MSSGLEFDKILCRHMDEHDCAISSHKRLIPPVEYGFTVCGDNIVTWLDMHCPYEQWEITKSVSLTMCHQAYSQASVKCSLCSRLL